MHALNYYNLTLVSKGVKLYNTFTLLHIISMILGLSQGENFFLQWSRGAAQHSENMVIVVRKLAEATQGHRLTQESKPHLGSEQLRGNTTLDFFCTPHPPCRALHVIPVSYEIPSNQQRQTHTFLSSKSTLSNH